LARTTATFAKRQKERARQEKQQAKMQRRLQRKLEKRDPLPASESGDSDATAELAPHSETLSGLKFAASEAPISEKEIQ
jgi:hypothetical protein